MFVKFRQNFIKISKKNTNFHAFFMKFELNNLFKLFKNDKIVTTFLLKFWDLSGAKVWKSCRSRKSWKNEYLVAIVAVDTAENGHPKVWRNWIRYSVVSLIKMWCDYCLPHPVNHRAILDISCAFVDRDTSPTPRMCRLALGADWEECRIYKNTCDTT